MQFPSYQNSIHLLFQFESYFILHETANSLETRRNSAGGDEKEPPWDRQTLWLFNIQTGK